MDSDEEYGFDATFVSEVPDYLKCVICHLVLRKPIQIMKCGHKFCDPCFNRIKSYSNNFNTELICPIDRNLIDLSKVFEDNGINRVIGDLTVKCVNNVIGCTWIGDLRNLKVHEEQCKHRVVQELHHHPSAQEVEGSSVLLKELCQRMLRCEDSLMEKGHNIAFLKFSLQEMKDKFNEKLVEINILNNERKNMEHELKIINNKNMELKQVEVKLENITLKNIILEQKVESLGNQLLQSQKQLEDNQLELAVARGEIGDVKSISEDHQLKISEVKDEVEGLKNNLYQKSSELWKGLQSAINDGVRKLNDTLDKSSSKQSDEISRIRSQVTTVEKQVEDRFNVLNEEVDQKLLGSSEKVCEDLRDHVWNIENILFFTASGMSKEIVLQWKLQNYQYHFDIGKKVFSPIFFTQMNGYRFKFKVHWRGSNKQNLYLGLYICSGSNENEVLEPFNVPHTLEMIDKDGNITSKIIRLDWIKANMKAHFTIPPGETCGQKSYGYTKFLTMPSLQNYIVNDTISIRCRLTPP